jgi:hypothetical protein
MTSAKLSNREQLSLLLRMVREAEGHPVCCSELFRAGIRNSPVKVCKLQREGFGITSVAERVRGVTIRRAYIMPYTTEVRVD